MRCAGPHSQGLAGRMPAGICVKELLHRAVLQADDTVGPFKKLLQSRLPNAAHGP